MVVLRSRVVDPKSKAQENPVSPDPTEPKSAETEPLPARRRSLRLASKSEPPENRGGSSGRLRKRRNNGLVEIEGDGKGGGTNDRTGEKGKGKVVEFDLNVVSGIEEDGVGGGGSSSSSSGAGVGAEERGAKRRVYTREEKGKGIIADFDLNLNLELSAMDNGAGLDASELMDKKEGEIRAEMEDCKVQIEKLVRELGDLESCIEGAKGKGKLVNIGGVSNGDELGESEVTKTTNSFVPLANRPPNSRPEVSSRMERFHEIARENAARFAHFASPEEEDYATPVEAEEDLPGGEGDKEVEDWPGPFSTALKIIRDREKKIKVQTTFSCSDKKENPVTWVPKGLGQKCLKRVAPSLKELCLGILANNADYLVSLEHVPDALRHTLSQKLCDSRKMNVHFFDLLLSWCPTEVRVRDCSWMTEEQFSESFQKFDASNLTVLQLDQCGRCTPDYIVLSTIARAPNSLPALTTLSLSGACRLSDVGMKALVSSAPRLRSINLSLCSLLTSSSLDVLADSFGSTLRELYINDCPSIDAMHILPALKKLQQLEVLALGGISNVSDKFMKGFIMERGYNMKELVLADCGKLTDSSVKVIAAKCSALCAIDLSNLPKLTDSAMGHLANGCRALKELRLSQNNFSDEGIAAFLETSGEILKVLSLNRVRKVGHNTALSIARRSRNLISLDLSWCRNLTDECVGLIVDSCLSLKMLKLFGCTQITRVFLDGHSNREVQIIGVNMSPILKHLEVPDHVEGPLQY